MSQGRVPGLASVVIPSYNKAAFIEATLNSIEGQTYPDLEIVVVDDGSTDDSVQIIEAWAAKSARPVRLVQNMRNQGVCRTLNTGLALAKGEFISCVAADDLYLPHKITSHVHLLDSHPRASFVFGDARVEDESGRLLRDSMTGFHAQETLPSATAFARLLDGNFIPALTVTMRGSSLDRVGPYDESLPYEDYDMWLRLAKVGDAVFSGTIDGIYLDSPGSLSKTLGPKVDQGHLMILAKYRNDPEVDRRTLDELALGYVARLVGNGPGGVRATTAGLVAATSLYGDSLFAARAFAIASSGWARSVRQRVRKRLGRLRQVLH